MKNIIAAIGILALLSPACFAWELTWVTEFAGAGYAGAGGVIANEKETLYENFNLDGFDDSRYYWFSEGDSVASSSLTTVPSGADVVLSFDDAVNLTIQAFVNTTHDTDNIAKSELFIRRGDANIYSIPIDGTRVTVCDKCNGDVEFYLIKKFKDLGGSGLKVGSAVAFVEA